MAKGKKNSNGVDKKANLDFRSYPTLLAVKPKEKYVFHSDYFEIDGSVATILSFFHSDGATDGFSAFWGIGRIPTGLDNDITTIGFEQIRKMSRSWIDEHSATAENVAQVNENENEKGGKISSRTKATRKVLDLQEISRDLADNAAYLECVYKMMVKAPTLEKLDKAINHISRQYVERFATLEAAPFMGVQRQELSNLFLKNDRKEGRPFYFTSPEFAGEYSLVTHGMEDPYGEYVGRMFGDVNNSAVMFEVNTYDHHVVVANETYDETRGRIHVSDYWGSKISQSCMIHNGRVVHIILDGLNLDKVGPKFDKLTYRINMNHGDVNMFEMFGDVKDEMSIFATQMQKLILMAEQAYETTDADRSIIRSSLEDVATKFYIDNKMWHANAQANRSKLRVTGIPHKSVPKLEMFVSYLNTEYQKALASEVQDPEKNHALGVLRGTFNNLLSTNGDLFNTKTSDAIDGAKTGRRVIYDFSELRRRGEGVAMAQLVNVIGFAVGNLGKGDTVIIHGTERIADRVKPYIEDQLDVLFGKGGRVCFIYNNIDKMIYDKAFSHFDKADYTIMGTLTESQVDAYTKSLGQEIPGDLTKLVTTKDVNLAYLRRGYSNVVFAQDLSLGLEKVKGARI